MIIVGYWKALKASRDFRGHTMKEYLDVLHNDIVTVWNFRDPQRVGVWCSCLLSTELTTKPVTHAYTLKRTFRRTI